MSHFQRLSRFVRPAVSLAIFGIGLTLFLATTLSRGPARADDPGEPVDVNVRSVRAISAEFETIHLKSADSKYAITLSVKPHGALITMLDGRGRMMHLRMQEATEGLTIYDRNGHQVLGLGQVGDNEPVLAVGREVGAEDGGMSWATFPRDGMRPIPGDKPPRADTLRHEDRTPRDLRPAYERAINPKYQNPDGTFKIQRDFSR